MSKHETPPGVTPRDWGKRNFVNSHTWNLSDYPRGNWNKHKKRRVRSAERTKGRRNRYELRHTIDGHYEG